jgi:hypothetical protein
MTTRADRVSVRDRGVRRSAMAVLAGLAVAAVVSVLTAPLFTPLMGTVGAVASILFAGQRWPSRMRWAPLAVFVLVIAASLFLEVPRLHLADVLGQWR